MPALRNPKHELFAQGLASGTSQAKAYGDAGYKAHTGNASKLAQDKSVVARIRQLIAEREEVHSQSTARAIEKVSLTKEWVLAGLINNYQRASKAVPATDADGNVIGEYRFQGSVANRALELLGKHLGMFVELHELSGKDGGPIQTQEVSPRERLFDLIDSLAARGRAGEDKGKPH